MSVAMFAKRRVWLVSAAAAVLLTAQAQASADVMRFTYTGSGSGTLNGVAFGRSNFTITAFGDTAARQNWQYDHTVWSIDHTWASISIAGQGDFDFLTGTRTFVNGGSRQVGFSRAGIGGYDLFSNLNNAAFGTWDMLTPIGPFSGNMNLKQWSGYLPLINTTGGILIFYDGSCNGAFHAEAVPEPATLGLVMAGLSALMIRRRTPRRW